MKKIAFISLVTLLMSVHCFSQNLKIYIVPVYLLYATALDKDKIKQESSLTIEVNKSVGTLDLEKLHDWLSEKKFTIVPDSMFSVDFRILCIFEYHGKKIKIYFSVFGDFLLDGVAYHDEKIRDLIFGYIPQSCFD